MSKWSIKLPYQLNLLYDFELASFFSTVFWLLVLLHRRHHYFLQPLLLRYHSHHIFLNHKAPRYYPLVHPPLHPAIDLLQKVLLLGLSPCAFLPLFFSTYITSVHWCLIFSELTNKQKSHIYWYVHISTADMVLGLPI